MLAFLLKEKLYLFEHPRVFIPFLSRAYKKIHFFDLREEKNWKKKEIAPFNKTRRAFSDGTNNWSRNHHVEKGEELLA